MRMILLEEGIYSGVNLKNLGSKCNTPFVGKTKTWLDVQVAQAKEIFKKQTDKSDDVFYKIFREQISSALQKEKSEK